MRILITILSIVQTIITSAQQHKTAATFEGTFGYRLYINSFNNSINTINLFNASKPVRLIGISYSGKVTLARGEDFDGHFSYHQLIPDRINFNDSITAKIGGFVFGFAYGKDLFRGSKIFDGIFALGFNTGRIKLNDREIINQKNPFFSPKISIQPKVNIKKISISCIVDCEYDISNASWKNQVLRKNSFQHINSFRQSSYTFSAAIGYVFN